MITYFGTGPMFGLPHASPFAIKGEILLKMAGVEYRNNKADLRKAPRGKMPWMDDSGTIIPDTSLIQKYLEETYNADFSGGYDAKTIGIGVAMTRMTEDHMYWLNTCIRWLQDENFYKGPIQFFDDAPVLIRPLIVKMIRGQVRKATHAHGISRYTDAERMHLATMSVDALADILGSNKYMLGANVSGADASIYGQLASLEAPFFKSPIGDYIRTKPNLMAYLERMRGEYFGDCG